MSPEERVAKSLIRDGKLLPLALPKPAKPPSAWSIRMDKAEKWKALRIDRRARSEAEIARHSQMKETAVWNRMKALQRKGRTLREISVEVKRPYEWVIDELYTRSLW